MHASKLPYVLTITIPIGKQVLCNTCYSKYEVHSSDLNLSANLILLAMHDFDVILRMSWLATCHAIMDCLNKMIKLKIGGINGDVKFEDSCKKMSTYMISSLKTSRLMENGCEGYIVFSM